MLTLCLQSSTDICFRFMSTEQFLYLVHLKKIAGRGKLHLDRKNVALMRNLLWKLLKPSEFLLDASARMLSTAKV